MTSINEDGIILEETMLADDETPEDNPDYYANIGEVVADMTGELPQEDQ